MLSTIKRKKKICIKCLTLQFIFSRGRCERCAGIEDYKPIAHYSENTEVELAIYRVLSRNYLLDNSICQCGRCEGLPAVEVHHKKGRGKYLNVVEFFLAVARVCHDWIHAHPKEAMKLGLLISKLSKDE